MADVAIRLLLIGVSDFVAEIAIGRITPAKTIRIQSCEAFLQLLDDPEIAAFHIAVVGAGLEGIRVIEIAQAMRGLMTETPIFYSHDSRESGFDRHDYVKNGFNDAFLFPFDVKDFSYALDSVLITLKKMAVFKSVKMIDIQPGQTLDFDMYLFLPVNKRYIRYSSAGKQIDAARVDKLKSHNIGFLFVPLDQMPKFYEHSASKLKELSSVGGGISATEKAERLQEAVRELMTGIFSTKEGVGFEDGKQTMATAGEIVKSFLSQSDQGSWYERISKALGDSAGSYSHLSNVSTIAALFSMATGVGKPEELAMAGLFHDIGLSLLSSRITTKPLSRLSEEERKAYQRHPEHSINLVKDKKIVLSQSVQTMILQHHERLDGTGYPLGLPEAKIRPESQLLAIADEFEELTKFEMGKPILSPEEALQKIKSQGGFNTEMITKLSEVLKAG